MNLPPDFVAELRKHFAGDIRLDLASRVLYSTDASIYQMEPLGVVLPRSQEDLHAAVELAARYGLPILPRGAGTSLAGQAIGHALIIDCSRWLDKLVEINAEERYAIAEPGLVLAALNRAAARHGLTFGPDPASAERATIGGVVGNNATGAHSILYGMAADHLLSADVILADGSLATMGEIPAEGELSGDQQSLYSQLRSVAIEIRDEYAGIIQERFPRTWRNSAGYRLNYLLPWSATEPPLWGSAQNRHPAAEYPASRTDRVNLAPLLAGSEGTLAVIRRVKLNLVPKPTQTVLAVLAYESVAEACDDVPRLLTHGPSAVELIPRMLIRLARRVPGYASQIGWVSGDPAALLVLEFSGESQTGLVERAYACGEILRVAITTKGQAQIWNTRKAGLGILDTTPGAARPVAFIEDCAIPVEQLGGFVREVEMILSAHQVEAAFYAHASAGCLHIRPILDLRTGEGRRSLRGIAEAVLVAARTLGGVMSSEHGDGLARSEWLRQEYGDEILAAMTRLKRAADPHSILNPGKIIDPPPMDTNLRFGPGYRVRPWSTGLDFSRAGGLTLAIEQCNGQGVCRKDGGVMCPSYQATRDEMHSTRGRANLLRALIASPAPIQSSKTGITESVYSALDLCLSCKGCKAECPSGVDMARLKSAFQDEYYKAHRRPLNDYIFAYFHTLAAVAAPLAPLINLLGERRLLRSGISRAAGIAPERPLPRFSRRRAQVRPRRGAARPTVLLLTDAFAHYVETHVEQAALDVLDAAGYSVRILPVVGAGAALLAKGFLGPARRHASRVLDSLRRLDPHGRLPVVGLEPPELYCLKNDYIDLLPGRKAEISSRTPHIWLLDEFLVRSEQAASLLGARTADGPGRRVMFQPHCHQRAESPAHDGQPSGADATLGLLALCGYDVTLIEAGCCGMAGTFGYEADHYALSQQIGELRLFPQVRGRGEALIAATGAACRLQIEQGTGAQAFHPVELVAAALGIDHGRPGG
jgi:FAD/FMN-containing dehydrogenase/Fe-S oxidoreductase